MVTRLLLVLILALAGLGPASFARADINNGNGTNVQEGDNERSSDQSGESTSGDAVAGQVVGVVSSGNASLDASNRTEDSSVETGDAEGKNASTTIVGLVNSSCGASITVDVCPAISDVSNAVGTNIQEGDNEAEIVQASTVASGDGVAGQIAGLVVSGTADLVLANSTEDSDVTTGDADFENAAASVVVLFSTDGPCCNLPTSVDGGAIDVT